jgi:hypothetical protein
MKIVLDKNADFYRQVIPLVSAVARNAVLSSPPG